MQVIVERKNDDKKDNKLFLLLLPMPTLFIKHLFLNNMN